MKDEMDGRGNRGSTVTLLCQSFVYINYLVGRRVFDVAVSVAQKICERKRACGDFVGKGQVSATG
jgi:hypothetical protein